MGTFRNIIESIEDQIIKEIVGNLKKDIPGTYYYDDKLFDTENPLAMKVKGQYITVFTQEMKKNLYKFNYKYRD